MGSVSNINKGFKTAFKKPKTQANNKASSNPPFNFTCGSKKYTANITATAETNNLIKKFFIL